MVVIPSAVTGDNHNIDDKMICHSGTSLSALRTGAKLCCMRYSCKLYIRMNLKSTLPLDHSL